MVQHQKWLEVDNYLITDRDRASVQLSIYHESYSQFKIKAYISKLWVEPSHRKKGIASRLLSQSEAIAKDAGCDAVFLEWHPLEAKDYAKKMYLNRGYHIVGTKGDPNDSILLRKPL